VAANLIPAQNFIKPGPAGFFFAQLPPFLPLVLISNAPIRVGEIIFVEILSLFDENAVALHIENKRSCIQWRRNFNLLPLEWGAPKNTEGGGLRWG